MIDYRPPDFAPGSVWVVGGGSGQPGYLSLLGLHALRRSDVVFHDAGLANEVTALASDAETIAVPTPNESVARQLAARARRGQRVVRLYLGDPLFFAAGAELAVLAESGLPVRVVPGIPGAASALANAGIPATHRETNAAVSVVRVDDTLPHGFHHLVRSAPVVVVELAAAKISMVRDALLQSGANTNCPVILLSLGPTARMIQQTELTALSPEAAEGSDRVLLVSGDAKQLFAATN